MALITTELPDSEWERPVRDSPKLKTVNVVDTMQDHPWRKVNQSNSRRKKTLRKRNVPLIPLNYAKKKTGLISIILPNASQEIKVRFFFPKTPRSHALEISSLFSQSHNWKLICIFYKIPAVPYSTQAEVYSERRKHSGACTVRWWTSVMCCGSGIPARSELYFAM